MGIKHKLMYRMYWTTRLYITLLMGITHIHLYHMYQQNVYYPSNGDVVICTGQQTVYYPSNGDYT